MDADRSRVGIVDADAERGLDPDAVAEAVEDAGGSPLIATADELNDRELAFAVVPGEDALQAVVSDAPDLPLLPVAVDAGVASAPSDRLEEALAVAVDGDADKRAYPVLSVRPDDGPTARGLRDVALVTAEPARISEYGVEAEAGRIAVVRADGIVVATPAGSHGYSAAAEGPLLAPGTGVSVVPIAPFVTDRDRWVLPPERIEITVRRDEAPVAVEVDGEEIGRVGEGTAVEIDPGESLRVLETSASTSPVYD